MFREIVLLSLLGLGSATDIGKPADYPPTVPEPRQAVDCFVEYIFNTTTGSATLRSVSYPNDYPENLDCLYDIKSPAGTQMLLNCADFNVEPSTNCAYDMFYMSLSGDPQFSDKTYACGRGTLTRNTTANRLMIGFKSDVSNPATGGPYRYECIITVRPVATPASAPASAVAAPAPAPVSAVAAPAPVPASAAAEARQGVDCSVEYTFNSTTGSATLRSVSFPNEYPANLNCLYDIRSPAATQMTLNCIDFNVEPSTNCAYDAFSMSLSGDPQFSDKTYACGRGTLIRNTTANRLIIGFKSDATNPATGGPYRYECIITVRPVATPASASAPAAAPASAAAAASAGAPASNATCSCGYRNENTRIVGGSNAGVSEFPWRVALVSPTMGAFCGGTIISPSWILTAAHCTNAIPAGSKLYVNAGDHDMSTTTEAANQVILVDKIVQNTNYNSKTQDKDTTLLHLKTPLTFTRTVQPVCLPWSMKGETFQGKTVTASGWGTTSYQGSASSVLQKVDLPVLTTSECEKYYPKMLTDNMLCTYNPGKDTCQGDSGGSIDMKQGDRYYAIGVVSWGVGCAGKDKPGVYAKATNFLDWIEANTAGETFCKA